MQSHTKSLTVCRTVIVLRLVLSFTMHVAVILPQHFTATATIIFYHYRGITVIFYHYRGSTIENSPFTAVTAVLPFSPLPCHSLVRVTSLFLDLLVIVTDL